MPCIVESHKTLDNKQIFKIADISQMLLVEHAVANEGEAVEASSSRNATGKSGFHGDDYIYPHGITPPMQWARKRRFRKRIHNRGIDMVEKEVENLLNDDRRAERVEFEYVDPSEADLIEEEIANTKYEYDAEDDEHASSHHRDSGDEEDQQAMDGEDDDENVDQDLAAELDAALAREHGDEGEEDSASNSDNDKESDEGSRADSDLEDLWDDDENEEEDGEQGAEQDAEQDADKDEDDGEEEAERRVRESQLEAECREIETLIRRKQTDIDATLNALIKSRHQQALRKLQVELDLKKKHLLDIKQLRRTIREERAAEAEARETAAAEAHKAREAHKNLDEPAEPSPTEPEK